MDVDSLTEVFAEKLPVTDGLYQGTVSSDEGDFIEDNARNTWVDWCGSAFWTAFGPFLSEADGQRPTVEFSDRLFSDEGLADTAVSVNVGICGSSRMWG